jgi:hypothetical protein
VAAEPALEPAGAGPDHIPHDLGGSALRVRMSADVSDAIGWQQQHLLYDSQKAKLFS